MNIKSEIIKKCNLFYGCSESETNLVLENSTSILVRAGDPVFVVNDVSRYVYIVMSGSINIVGQGHFKNQYFKIRTAGPHEHFAELSILAADRHRTSAFAAEDAELLCIEGAFYLEFFRQNQNVSQNQIESILGYYFQNIRSHVSLPVLNDLNEVRYDKSFLKLSPVKLGLGRKAVPIRIESNIVSIAVCTPVSTDLIESIRAQYPTFKVKLHLMDEAQVEKCRKMYLNFYSGQNLSPIAVSATQPVGAPNADFEDLRLSTLMLSQLPTEVFNKLASFFEVYDFSDGDVIFSPTRVSDRLYFVGSGTVELDKGVKALGGAQICFAKAEQYDCFFDTVLFNESDSNITAIARSKCRIFSISKDVFLEVLKLNDFAIPFAITLAQMVNDLNKNKTNIEFYVGGNPNLNPQTLHLLPKSKMTEAKILPLHLAGKDLTLGMLSISQEILNDVIDSHLRGFNVKICLISEENFNAWMVEAQAIRMSEDTITVFKNSPDDNRVLQTIDPNLSIALEQLLEGAIEGRASDIHFEPTEKFLIVRYRIDGVMMQLWNNIPIAIGESIIRRIKVLCEMNISENRLPQDGKFHFKKNEVESSFRVSSVPTRFGEKIVLRTTGRKNSVIPLQLLAPDTKITKFFNRLVKYQQGIFFITGPTGSGKSTTLYSILNELNKPDRNIITIEDPIEANITGINQIQIHPDIGLTHESILRNVLRQDPDVIMVGEIRDAVSMQLALDAALSGQLVLTTIHAGSVFEVIPRIKELGASTSHIASGLIGVMSQRLVRCLCTACKKPRAVTSKELELFKNIEFNAPLTQTMTAVGCSKCNFSGFSGQIPVFEFWEKTIQVHNALMDHANSEEIARAIQSSNVESLTSYGLKMVAQGLTTISEVNDVLFGVADLIAS